MIKHEGEKWVLYSADGSKTLGTYDSEEAAQEREREIQKFKHMREAQIYGAVLEAAHGARGVLDDEISGSEGQSRNRVEGGVPLQGAEQRPERERIERPAGESFDVPRDVLDVPSFLRDD